MKNKLLWVCPECLYVQKNSKSRCDCGELDPVQRTRPIPYIPRTALTQDLPALVSILEMATFVLEGKAKVNKKSETLFVTLMRYAVEKARKDL